MAQAPAGKLVMNTKWSSNLVQEFGRPATASLYGIATGVTGADMLEQLGNAMALDGVPAIGSTKSHPVYGTMYLSKRTAEQAQDGSIKLSFTYCQQLEYGGSGAYYAEISGASESCTMPTTFDVNGNRVTVAFTYPSDSNALKSGSDIIDANYPPDTHAHLRGKTDYFTPEIASEAIETTLTIVRNEICNPLAVKEAYEDTIAMAGWKTDPLAKAGMWRMMAITFAAQYGGTLWRMAYTMKKRNWMLSGNRSPWCKIECYQRPWDGKPPSGDATKTASPLGYPANGVASPAVGNGTTIVDQFPLVDWNALNLSVIGPNPPQPF